MLRPSRRDQLALEPLLPFIDREITEDPEQRDPTRRAARREGVAHATSFFRNLRVEEDERKDRELRARLDGVATSSRLPTHSGKQPAIRYAARADANTIRLHSGYTEEWHRASPHRTPLTHITNPASIDTTSARPPVKRSSLSTTVRPTTGNRPSTTAIANEGIITPPDRQISDLQKVETHISAFQRPLVLVQGPSNIVNSVSRPLDTLDDSVDASIGRTQFSSDPARVLKSSEPHSQQSKQSSQAPTLGVIAVDSSTPIIVGATHGRGRLEPRSGASTFAAMGDARACSVLQHRGRTPICGLLHRKDFEVKRICRKLFVDEKDVYVVSWKQTWVPVKLIVEGNNVEYPYVDADGTRWNIKETSGHRERQGIEEVKVRWMTTNEPADMLNNAQEAIDIFEADFQLAGADEIARVRQRITLTFAQSYFPYGSVLPQSEEDYAASQQWVSSLWPEIRPHRTLDLYPAIYRIHMELASRIRKKKHGGKSYRCLMKLPQLRPLRWSQDFLDSGASLKCCRRKRASLFIQATGTEVFRHCTRCSHGRLTPFLECVQTSPDQQLWLNGACANCGTQGNLCCDYHGVFVGRASGPHHPARSRNDQHPTSTVLQRDGPAHTTLNRDDDEGSETSDDDSDDDDDEEEENDDDESDDNTLGEAAGAGSQAVAPGSRPCPPFPTNLRVKDFAFSGTRAAIDSARSPSSGSSITFRVLSASSPIRSERRGKLPSVSKIRDRLSGKSLGQTSSLAALHQRMRARQQGNEHHSRQNVDVDEPSQVQPESSATPKSAGENYTPQPIELDLLKLASKYDHLQPLKHRTSRNVVSASASTAVNREPGRADTAVDQTAQPMSVQNKPTLHSSPEPASPVSKKRPASMPPLHRRRPTQRQAFMIPGDPASPTSELPSTAPTAPPKLAAPEHVVSRHSTSAKTFLHIRTLAHVKQDIVHKGCQAGQPCRDYSGPVPIPRDPHAKFYRHTLLGGRQISLEEAEYIVSRANCYWARKFTVLWDRWCEERGGIEHEERSQVEWLLSYPDLLRNAAGQCCPNGPRRSKAPKITMVPNDVIIVDD